MTNAPDAKLSAFSVSGFKVIAAAHISKTAVPFFAAKINFAHQYIYRLPHQFNRNPIVVVEVGTCRGRGDGNCVYILICTNTVTVLFHNKNRRYTQRKVLLILPNNDLIYTDNILYRLPGGCIPRLTIVPLTGLSRFETRLHTSSRREGWSVIEWIKFVPSIITVIVLVTSTCNPFCSPCGRGTSSLFTFLPIEEFWSGTFKRLTLAISETEKQREP